MRIRSTLLAIVLLSGCSDTYIGDAFELTMLEHCRKYKDCGEWSTEDYAIYAKMEAEEYQLGSRDVMGLNLPEEYDQPAQQKYNVTRWQGRTFQTLGTQITDTVQNYPYSGDESPVLDYEGARSDLPFSTPCLDFSHRAFDLISESSNQVSEMRVVTIVLSDATLDKRGGPRYGYGIDKHAMLLVDGTIYDNGYLSNMPFDYEDLSYYGDEISNVWSLEKYRGTL